MPRPDLRTDKPPYQEGKRYLLELNGLLFQATYYGPQSTVDAEGRIEPAFNGRTVMQRWVDLVFLRAL